jgi:hypothetical protein
VTVRWTFNKAEDWGALLRFALKVAFFLNMMMLAVFSVWFTAMLLWRLCQYLRRTWLGHPW